MSDSVNHHRSFEVLTAEPVRSRRKLRHWSDEDKARLVAEALAPGSNVSAIARSHGLDPSQVYAWRRKALASGAVSPLTGGRSSRSGSRALKRWAVRWWKSSSAMWWCASAAMLIPIVWSRSCARCARHDRLRIARASTRSFVTSCSMAKSSTR